MNHIQRINFLILLMVVGVSAHAQKFHDLSLVDVDKNTVGLQSLQGKKVMVIVLSGGHKDITLMNQIVEFEARYKDSIKVIGALSYEDGYNDEHKTVLLKGKREAMPAVLFTEGLYTRLASGARQSPLIKWLTAKEQNKHFADEVRGVGHKFFLDETGELYAVLGPEVLLTSKLIERVVKRR